MGRKLCQVSFRYLLMLLFLSSFLACLCLSYIPSKVISSELGQGAIAQSSEATQLMQQGIDSYHSGDIQGAVEFWRRVEQDSGEDGIPSEEQVRVWKYLARGYQQLGQVEEAIAQLDRVISYCRQTGNRVLLGRMLTEQAQAYSSLGEQRKALTLLCNRDTLSQDCQESSALQIARSQSDYLGEAAALGSLGNIYHLQAHYDLAIKYLRNSLEIASEIGQPASILAAQNGLGNIYTSLARRDYRYAQLAQQTGDEKAAQAFFEKAQGYENLAAERFEASLIMARTENDQIAEMRALLNLIVPAQRNPQVKAADFKLLIKQGLVLLESLPDSREKVYATIKFANFLEKSQLDLNSFNFDPNTQCPTTDSSVKGRELLEKAVTIAEKIQDETAKSFAFGRLGHVYECRGESQQALSLTHQAQLATIKPEILYLWQWQEGRILRGQGKETEAINAYQSSFETLKSVKGDLAIASRDFQLDFQEMVEPVYRQLAELRLKHATNFNQGADYQAQLQSALATIDELRLAEIQNYLGDECEITFNQEVDYLANSQVAIFNSIILEDRIAIILTLPDKEGNFKSQMRWLPVSSQEAREIINDFRLNLEMRFDRAHSYRERAKQLYDWFITPFAADLEQANIKTLVFMQDGILRSIPMAALYDGQQFLVEKYAIANTQTLTLTSPRSLERGKLKVVAFGLSQPSAIDSQTYFPPLRYVESEINNIQATIPTTQGILDSDFTPKRLQQELNSKSPSILHLATHAQFGFDAKQTFLVTGNLVRGENNNDFNELLTINELYQMVKNRDNSDRVLDLLTLTACQTAVGSERDALGIAGIALQAGVQSTVASLWRVDDQATAELITGFYQSLQAGLSKAEALQTTQKHWLEKHPSGPYKHPGYWASFILVGSWL